MAKQKIPVYDICSLTKKEGGNDDILIERFESYLEKHYQHLHYTHGHSFYHLVLFTKGAGEHTIDFTSFKVKPFQLYFMIPGQVHSWHFKEGVGGYIINFSPGFLQSFLHNQNYLERFLFFSGNSADGVCQVPVQKHEDVVELFEKLLKATGKSRENVADITRLLLLELFIRVDNIYTKPNSSPIPQQKQLLLRGFNRLIDAHFRTLRLPNEYADLLYVTPNHLNALCKDLLGKTAGELIRDRILLEAKRMLTSANMTITEIAYDLNFQDNSYFNRFFKKYTGTTPDEFRKQLMSSK